ncbi:nucleotidyltransferase [Cytophagaceae bacterium YF14B1]|uniref:Nucleotidyltransferase n=1 Tax=Xanthocytophaga flava TaxID=3048013 RepID=A0AAE3QV06_9BACT|nr:nucleotidyltransferase [Xanthocytophaga flavus]MDJ1485982.1 nucleotidyltransferase [Xanthocytophaga flavus]
MSTTLLLEMKKQRSNFLEKLADSLDLTEDQHKKAKERYQAVGEFLSQPGTLLAPYRPHVIPQGSIRIGTSTRPVIESEEFDIDLTCKLSYSFPATQSELRSLLKERLCQDANYKRMLEEEHRRCLRLHYSEDSRFHLDIVPAISDPHQWLLDLNVPVELAQHAIVITDTQHAFFNRKAFQEHWPKSNTEGYALWFLEIMKKEAEQIRMKLQKELLLEKIEQVPDYKVRTPLQRGIQLMKRHRDIMFDGDEKKPTSVILTTLAAKAYESVMRNPNSLLFVDIIGQMIDLMPTFIDNTQGHWTLKNPVNPLENFADKWNSQEDKQERAKKFFHWHQSFKKDYQQLLTEQTNEQVFELSKDRFGSRSVNLALQSLGIATSINNVNIITNTAGVNTNTANKIITERINEPVKDIENLKPIAGKSKPYYDR